MKSLVAALLMLVACCNAGPADVRRLTPTQHSRFLQEKDDLKDQVLAWKQSDAGQYAIKHGLVDATIQGDNSNRVADDELERFFRTKLGIEQAQKDNPQALFSTNTPFTMMTDQEFARFVGDSFNESTIASNLRLQEAPTAPPALRAAVANDYNDSNNNNNNSNDSFVIAESIDWTTSGCVKPVQDQGTCGSCWAFAGVTVLESAHCLQNGGKLHLFSEQQINSCDPFSLGCGGGFAANVLNFVQEHKRICTQESYPYVSGTTGLTGSCRASACDAVSVSIVDILSPEKTESGFLAALNVQPLAVAVAAGNPIWKQYAGGIITTCPSAHMDHAVTLVGYGTSHAPYYKIQNSWGDAWGDHGFIYLARGGSTCGILNDYAVYPVLSSAEKPDNN